MSNALKERGLQFHVTTEIGNVTLAAMATAATKDSSFPGGYGQISSYVSAMRLVTPSGDIREINERDNPEEMQIMRSSYGLLGIVFEVTIKVRPTTALSVRHHSMGCLEFRKRFPVYKAQGFAVMYYIFPYVRRVLVELGRTIPPFRRSRAGAGPTATASGANTAPPSRSGSGHAPRIASCATSPTSSISSSCARGWSASCAATRPGRTPRSSTTRAIPATTNICSACGPSARADFFESSTSIATSSTRMSGDRLRCDLPCVGYSIVARSRGPVVL